MRRNQKLSKRDDRHIGSNDDVMNFISNKVRGTSCSTYLVRASSTSATRG
jgi:hypothetical protein